MAQRDEWKKAAILARPLIFEYENPALLRGQQKGAKAYRDEGGWTIGFGVRTHKGEKLNDKGAFAKYVKSEEQKIDGILSRLSPAADAKLTLNQKAQVFSFIHNVTERSGNRGIDVLNSKGFDATQKYMESVVKGAASRRPLEGLVQRRKDEKLLGQGHYNNDTTRGPSLAGLQNLYGRFMKSIGETVDTLQHATADAAGAAKDFARKNALAQNAPIPQTTTAQAPAAPPSAAPSKPVESAGVFSRIYAALFSPSPEAPAPVASNTAPVPTRSAGRTAMTEVLANAGRTPAAPAPAAATGPVQARGVKVTPVVDLGVRGATQKQQAPTRAAAALPTPIPNAPTPPGALPPMVRPPLDPMAPRRNASTPQPPRNST
jgi:GH24 family phage-related lysozyme (muramidase)